MKYRASNVAGTASTRRPQASYEIVKVVVMMRDSPKVVGGDCSADREEWDSLRQGCRNFAEYVVTIATT